MTSSICSIHRLEFDLSDWSFKSISLRLTVLLRLLDVYFFLNLFIDIFTDMACIDFFIAIIDFFIVTELVVDII